VNAALRERPAKTGAGDGGRPARRAVVRWAWRLFRREWRQQLLVLALITVAVAATTVGAAVATSTPSSPEATFGTASFLVTLPGSDPHLAAGIAAIRKRFGTIEMIAHQKIAIPGSAATVDLRAQDPNGPYGHPMLRLDAGRYPAGPDQVAVTSEVAAIFRLRTGGIWHVGGRALRVTGLVENPQNLLDEFALAAPGQLSPPDQVTILLDATAPGAASFSFPAGSDAVARPSAARTSAAEAVLVLATLGLLFTGLVAVAGFTVMAHRRLRALGMLGALGATDRHVRLVMLANGAIVGAAGMLTGAAIGLAGWIALVPHLETTAGHRIDRFSLPWPTIATAMVLAVATSIAAAWWPAQSAARIPVVAALSGRPPRPQPGRRFAVPGGLLLAAGLGFLAFADQNGGIPPLVIAGTLATTLGVLFLAPLGIAGLAAVGRRSPIAWRLALRDLSRYQARSGAALAAISLAVGIAATIAIAATQAATQAAEAAPTGPNLPANQLIVYLSPGGLGGFIPEQSAAELPGLQARVNALAASLHAQNVLALESAVNPAATASLPAQGNRPAGQQPAGLVKVVPGCSAPAAEYAGQVYVATPALLQHYGIGSSSIDPAADILTSRTGLSGVQLASGAVHGCGYDSDVQYIRQPPIQTVNLPTDTSDPNTLLTTHALKTLGWRAIPAGWLIQTPQPLTAAQVSTARQIASAAGISIETRSAQDSLSRLRDFATGAGLLLALGVLAMTVGLIRSETGSDLRTLAAAGASSRTRRTLTAATAGALALLGALLGTTGAYLALIAWHRTNLGTLSNVPIASLSIILIGLPLAATTAGWLLAGHQPPAIARRPIE
jgi:putative ABC transport system permease protein